MRSESPERDRLLRTASALFYRHGLTNVGINRIIDEANIARMTLYNNFEGKIELVLEYLRMASRKRIDMILTAFEECGTPEEKVRAFFGIAEGLAMEPDFRGCCFINAAAQVSDPEGAVHRIAKAHKACIRSLILNDILKAVETQEAPDLAEQILALWDGAIVEAYIQRTSEPVRASLRAALTLLRAATSQAT